MKKRAFLAAAAASAGMAAPARAAIRPYVPMAPTVNMVRGPYPGDPDPGMSMSTAATDVGNQTIYYTQPLTRLQKAHEMGHLLDSEALTSADRLRFEQLAGFGKGRWDIGTGLTAGGTSSPDEFFADWYANAAVGNDPGGAKGGSWEAGYASPPSHRQFRQFERWLAGLGKSRGLKMYQR